MVKKGRIYLNISKFVKPPLSVEVKFNGLCAVKTDPDISLLFTADRYRIRKFAKSLNFPNLVLKKFDFQKDGSSRESLITD